MNASFAGLARVYPLTPAEAGWWAELQAMAAEYNKRHPAEKKK